MIVLFGPCMLVAPLLILLIPVAVVLWPPVLVLLGVLYLLLWPFAALMQGGAIARAHAAVGRWFMVLLRPWRYFDAPRRGDPPSASS